MQIFRKKYTYKQRKCSTGSDIGHWQFLCYICDKSQTHMCPIFLTESMVMRLKSIVTLQNGGTQAEVTFWEHTYPRAVIDRP